VGTVHARVMRPTMPLGRTTSTQIRSTRLMDMSDEVALSEIAVEEHVPDFITQM